MFWGTWGTWFLKETGLEFYPYDIIFEVFSALLMHEKKLKERKKIKMKENETADLF